jgi:hypothetical protein
MKAEVTISEIIPPQHGTLPFNRPIILLQRGWKLNNSIAYRGRDNKDYLAVLHFDLIGNKLIGEIIYKTKKVLLAEQELNPLGIKANGCQWDNVAIPGFGLCAIKIVCED